MNETIMIVDDSPYIVDGLAALLKRKEYRPVIAHDGDECLRELERLLPDLILLDIMMEPKDGWETLEEIRSNPKTKEIPVLMFSAKKISPEEAGEHSMCIDDFVPKPINPGQLLDAIGRVFSRQREMEEELRRAGEAGLDAALMDEYRALRRSVDVDIRMLTVLKAHTGMDNPGKEVPEEDRAAIGRLEEKVAADTERLRSIRTRFETVT
ncbi:MAG TPA: response regulator [Methanoregulaceae archaeon]|nr:response regulator [Methanoregulaceae archaeon]HPD74551.1 response regulator [Methanoregulaceae archaeon]HRY74824.1 response regulator [Methanoregulaceae archaeon]